MRKMGISNFKPSIHHKVQSGHKVFNILNNPMIALASPRIECQWVNGMPPRPPKLNRKLQDDFDDRANSELMLSIDAINQPAKSPRKSSRKKAKKLAAAKARKIARQNGDVVGTLGSGQSSPVASGRQYEGVDLVSDSSTESKHRKKQENNAMLLSIGRRAEGEDATAMSNPSPERSMAQSELLLKNTLTT